jgi:two-component system response regulator HydG
MNEILIIDNDAYTCNILEKYLTGNKFNTDISFSGKKALKKIRSNQYDLVICEYQLPDIDGIELLQQIKEFNPLLPVVIMTTYKNVRLAVRMIKAGAFDYVTKPVNHQEILDLISEALRKEREDKGHVEFQEDFITGESELIKKVMEDVRIVAPVEMTVLIEGETGSGKEYIARAIHFNSKRRNRPFVAVDCGALPKGLANSELFGHRKGSFTDASFDKKGVFEQANGGTLFLDEISNLSYENQIKLLRAIQERKITRLGDVKNIDIDIRIIVASNEDLFEEMRNHNIREDLYHRINEFRIKIPPLKERGSDILIFANEFIRRAGKRFGKNVKGYDAQVKKLLLQYPWHGNIRELRNVINRAVLLVDSEKITVKQIPEEIRNYCGIWASGNISVDMPTLELKEAALEAEKQVIIYALNNSNHNKSKAAKILNVDRKTLYNKIKHLHIQTTGN